MTLALKTDHVQLEIAGMDLLAGKFQVLIHFVGWTSDATLGRLAGYLVIACGWASVILEDVSIALFDTSVF